MSVAWYFSHIIRGYPHPPIAPSVKELVARLPHDMRYEMGLETFRSWPEVAKEIGVDPEAPEEV